MPYFRSEQAKLSNVLETPIQTGFQVRGQVQPNPQGNYSLLQVKDAVRSVLYHIKSEGLDKIVIHEKKRKFMNKYLVQKNDVLYLSKLNPGAFQYTGSTGDTVPMAHFYILRPKSHIIDSGYLCWTLNQNFTQPYIQKRLKGTILPFISKDALLDLKIPLPGLSIQKKIIEFLKLKMQENEIQKTIENKKNILINTILHKLL